MLYANQWPKYFVNQQYTTLTFANFRRPILRSRVIYKPFQKIVGEISIVRFTPSNFNNLITSYSAFIDLSFFSYMMHTSSEERGPRVVVIYWEIRHEATESATDKWPIDQCWYDLWDQYQDEKSIFTGKLSLKTAFLIDLKAT